MLLRPGPDQEDFLIADLWERGTSGILDEDGGIRAFFDADSDAAELLRQYAEFGVELRAEPSTDWVQATEDAWPPLLIGRRFFVVPPWCKDPTPAGRLRLEITPGMACGTGRHPATQLCLQAIEQHVRAGDRVLDIGTGSGILSSAAALVGAGQVIGCDIDPEAVRVARERQPGAVFLGSACAVRAHWADVILANIDAAAIEQLAGEFERIRHPGTTLILSGFPEWDLPEGFHPKEVLRLDEWGLSGLLKAGQKATSPLPCGGSGPGFR